MTKQDYFKLLMFMKFTRKAKLHKHQYVRLYQLVDEE